MELHTAITEISIRKKNGSTVLDLNELAGAHRRPKLIGARFSRALKLCRFSLSARKWPLRFPGAGGNACRTRSRSLGDEARRAPPAPWSETALNAASTTGTAPAPVPGAPRAAHAFTHVSMAVDLSVFCLVV